MSTRNPIVARVGRYVIARSESRDPQVQVGRLFVLLYRTADHHRLLLGMNRVSGKTVGIYINGGQRCLSIGRYLR